MDTEKMELELLLIRHGATASNESGRYLGKTDEALSGIGKERLYARSNERKLSRPDFLFSSPMRRCLETAEILYETDHADTGGKQTGPVMISEWTEMDFGDFEGKNYRELNGNPYYQAWIDSNGTLPFPNGESREQFVHRCMLGFDRMILYIKNNLTDITHSFKNTEEKLFSANAAWPVKAAAVVHGGTIMSVLSELTGKEYFDFQVPNGEGYQMKLCLGNQSGDTDLLELISYERI